MKSSPTTVLSDWNFTSGGIRLPQGSTCPSNCAEGEICYDTDATTGARLFACESAVWVAQGGGGSSNWTDGGSFLNPADLSGAEDIITGGTTVAGADIVLYASGATTINQQGDAEGNFRVEGDTDPNMIFADANSNNVGIGTVLPSQKLHVEGNMRLVGSLDADSYPDFDTSSELAGILTDESGSGADLFASDATASVRFTNWFEATDRIRFSSLNCSIFSNGGKITTDSAGILKCLDDTSAAGGSTEWTDSTTNLYPNETTDDVILGGTSPISSAKFTIDGDDNQLQFVLQGFSTQTANLGVIEESDGTDLASWSTAEWAFNSSKTLSFGTTGRLRLPVSATLPSTCTNGEVYFDSDATNGQRIYGCQNNTWVLQGGRRTVCAVLESLISTDDNYAFYMANDSIKVEGIGCNCRGTCSTLATFTLEDRGGNAMTITGTNPTCATTGTATFVAVTAGNQLTAGEMVAFDVTNTPTTGDTYTLCINFIID